MWLHLPVNAAYRQNDTGRDTDEECERSAETHEGSLCDSDWSWNTRTSGGTPGRSMVLTHDRSTPIVSLGEGVDDDAVGDDENTEGENTDGDEGNPRPDELLKVVIGMRSTANLQVIVML